jgi:hypothetical protein
MSTKILTPPARIVWGHPLEKQIKTDPKTRKPILKDGKEQDVWSCGLAIPVAQFQPIEQAIAAEAYRIYPNGQFPVDRYGNPDFAWKIKRETDLDENRKPYGEREGYKGHVVLSCSTQAFCPSAYKFENGQYRQLQANEFKCGDWVIAELTISAHQGGVYINPNMFQVIGYDQEIQRRGGADPSVFANVSYQLPPGVSATPVAPVGNVAPPAAAPAYAPPAMPTTYAPAAPTHGVSVSPPGAYAPAAPLPPPAHDFVNNAMGNVAPVAVAPPAPGFAPGVTSFPSNIPGIPQR